jgi:transposase
VAVAGRTWLQQARAGAALTAQPSDPVEYRATVRALRTTAERALAAHAETNQLEKELRVLVAAMAPALLARPGVGPITAAQVLISWSHPGRLRSEAAFARLAGAAPIPASSGRVVRHRLNRGGDRQLNRALHTIVMIRERYHQPTKGYVARRTTEGKSQREIRRCLKRTVARQLYRLLTRTATGAGR